MSILTPEEDAIYKESYFNLIGKTKKNGFVEPLITSNMTPKQVQLYMEFLKLQAKDVPGKDLTPKQKKIYDEFLKLKAKSDGK